MISLRPRTSLFHDLFEKLAAHVVSASEHLRRLADDFSDSAKHIKAIRQEELDADELLRAALSRLDRSLITPFDREDIHLLVNGLENIVDNIDALAKRFPLYHITANRPAFAGQVQTLVQTTIVVQEAVLHLRKSRSFSKLNEKLVRIHELEKIGDEQNHAAISDLFSGAIDPLTAMKWKELHDLVETAIDGCEDVGNTLQRIVLKNG